MTTPDEAAPEVESKMLTEARAEVGIADHKATMVLSTVGIGFGAFIGGLLAGDWEPSDYSGRAAVIWWLAAVMAISSVLCAASAVWPRFTANDVTKGIYFWGHVARFKTIGELNTALNKKYPDDGDRTRHQLFRLSRIVRRKYVLVRWSMSLAGLAAGVFVVSALVNAA